MAWCELQLGKGSGAGRRAENTTGVKIGEGRSAALDWQHFFPIVSGFCCQLVCGWRSRLIAAPDLVYIPKPIARARFGMETMSHMAKNPKS